MCILCVRVNINKRSFEPVFVFGPSLGAFTVVNVLWHSPSVVVLAGVIVL